MAFGAARREALSQPTIGKALEAGRRAFEKAFEYEIIPPDSEINQRIKEEAKLRRPGMYE